MSAQKSVNIDHQKSAINNATIDDEDYIEEDFEEDNSDSPIEEVTGSDDEEDRLE